MAIVGPFQLNGVNFVTPILLETRRMPEVGLKCKTISGRKKVLGGCRDIKVLSLLKNSLQCRLLLYVTFLLMYFLVMCELIPGRPVDYVEQ